MTRLQDDFYDSVNGNWEKGAQIPGDKPVTGGFVDLSDEIEKLMLEVTDQWLAGENLPDSYILTNFIKYHSLASDYQGRENAGISPALLLIEEYKQLASFEEYVSKISTFALEGKPNFFPFSVSPDFMDAKLNVLWAKAPSTILPDTTYYSEDHPQRESFLSRWRECTAAVLKKFEFSEDEIDDLLGKVEVFDAHIAKYVLSCEESSAYSTLYHPYKWGDFKKLTSYLPLDEIFEDILGQTPDRLIVPEERFWKAADEFYSPASWDFLKSYLILNILEVISAYLTDEIRVLSSAFNRFLTGTPQAMNSKKAAFYLAQEAFDQAIGLWYVDENFSPEAKADVEVKVESIIAAYKDRLVDNDWLAPETRDKAITKLNTIRCYIGYPSELPKRYQFKLVDDRKSLLENAFKLHQVEISHYWSQWNQLVDDKEWEMPAHSVNAYYNPQKNLIVFPAAILQSPFYDIRQTSSENYGGIGAVIAHEISHAFDTNGALFDENGSLNNWWTESDYAAFTSRTQKLIDLFEGQDAYGIKVNGQLTVSENTADLGGLSAALEAAKQESDFSAEKFFTSWARIWRLKARPEYMRVLASTDVHAPAKLRVNLQVQNFSDFFKVFDINEGDGMWRSEEERIQIW